MKEKIRGPVTAYEIVLENESVHDVAQSIADFRNAWWSITDTETMDAHYQHLLNRIIDALIVTYDSGGIDSTISGFREGMRRRRMVAK